MNNESRITDIVDFNPPRKLKKGQIAPFIDMAALPTNERDIVEITEKAFTGGAKFRNGDTLFARITPCLENGKTGKVSNLSDEVIGHGSTEFIVMTAKDSEIDEDYVYYLARLPEFRKFAQMRMTGTSGRQRVSWQDLAEFTFAFPEPEKRKAAGVFLKTIDDKIQLNTQTNQTLEHIAQAIYKSWFVDYEPTRAKATVLAAGGSRAEAETAAMTAISGKSAAELAALAQNHPARYQQLATLAQAFPAALVPTDGFGEIPEGWEVSTIGESVETVGGATPSTKEESFWLNGDIHWTTPKDLSNLTDNILIDTNKKITAQGLKKISSGLLPVNTVLMSSRAPVGYLALTKIPVAINQGYIAIKPFGKLGCYYMIQWCYSNMEEIKGRAIGTTFAEISKTNFRGMKIVVPPKFVLAAYNKIIEPIYNRITSNNYESKQLSNTRDLLLPKLLSNGIL
jgi:hsdA